MALSTPLLHNISARHWSTRNCVNLTIINHCPESALKRAKKIT
jgi:hypothetical protein